MINSSAKYSVVVITNGNRENVLKACVLSASSFAHEVIVVGAVTSLEDMCIENLKLIDKTELAKAGKISELRNIGVDFSSGDYIINCDDDIIFPPYFSHKLGIYLDNNQDFHSCSVKIIGSNGGRHWDRPVFKNNHSHMIDYDDYDDDLYYTGGFIIRERAFAQQYPFDSNLKFNECEDVAYSNLIKDAGFTINIDKENTVYHVDPRYITVENTETKILGCMLSVTLESNKIYNQELYVELQALLLHYGLTHQNTRPKNFMSLKQFESRTYSPQGEDSIIKHIFDNIGTTNRIAVEFGVSMGEETNTRLLTSHGWHVVWIDCQPKENIPIQCTFIQKFLTVDNIVETFEEAKVPKEFDLLSIDVDSNDYHLRQALKDYSPRAYVIEYNGSFDGTEHYVMPYDTTYQWDWAKRDFGASLKSLYLQGQELGYDLVYCESRGVNAFFVRKDINPFPALTSEEAWVQLCWTKPDFDWSSIRLK